MEEFSSEDVKDYIDTMVDYAKRSDDYFIIIGMREPDDLTPILYDVEGFPIEDVLTLIEETIHHIGE